MDLSSASPEEGALGGRADRLISSLRSLDIRSKGDLLVVMLWVLLSNSSTSESEKRREPSLSLLPLELETDKEEWVAPETLVLDDRSPTVSRISLFDCDEGSRCDLRADPSTVSNTIGNDGLRRRCVEW